MMIKQIRHTGLVVTDLGLALSFWKDLLGFTIDKQMDESGPYRRHDGLKKCRSNDCQVERP
jgi:catechol 2,3-dioxygenase-like lactoylglutathione lyase family enzyme